MENWRTVWREGFAPLMPVRGLTALRDALVNDDPRLIQGNTTTPPPLVCVQDWPVEAACALGFCGWQGEGMETVGDVEGYFNRSTAEADQRLGEAAACRRFLNWFDETPRAEMRKELLAEVDRELDRRPEADTVLESDARPLAAVLAGGDPEEDDEPTHDEGNPVG